MISNCLSCSRGHCKKMMLRNPDSRLCFLLKRRASTILQNKTGKVKFKQEKERKMLRQEEVDTRKPPRKITAELSNIEYQGDTLPGCKKDVSCALPATYSSRFVEACWYQWWEKEGFFKPAKTRNDSEVFSMVIPPPNVTGNLHLGHALTVALEDVLCRWRRMRGDEVVWVPGCDHAGIATQAVVERLLARSNVTRHQLGRDKFLQEVWKWKEDKEGRIYSQLQALGASLDWTRTNFTLNPDFSHAVREAFIQLHERDLIYRKKSLINWSCQLQSTISDIEIDNKIVTGPTDFRVPGYKKKVEFGVMHTFSYPLMNPTTDKSSIDVSTTRIETMLGDAAVAVNPCDERFASLVGGKVCHPLLPGVTLPIIADDHVAPEFGTGAVKITPAHDFYDFEIGQRHKLPVRSILDDCGNITNTGLEDYDGVPRFIARQKVIEALIKTGYYKGKKPHEMNLPLCSRSGDVIEPRIKTQWFLRTKHLAQKALEAVEKDLLKIEPESHLGAWNNWLSNSQDWCISRQLWWGHRIPAYFVESEGESKWVSAHDEEGASKKAGLDECDKLNITQDEDVLDTWFSSALFPFAVFGWPDETEDLTRYYPLSVMETGHDLLFFWVARMTMLGIALTGKVPFETVYLHNMVRDSQGRKMSKSLGNVIDPLQVVNGCTVEELDLRIKSSNLDEKEEKIAIKDRKKSLPHGIPECGTDALRFYLCRNKKSGKDISLDVNSVVQQRFFCNKIWNAFKFLQANMRIRSGIGVLDASHLRPVDRWILSSLSATVETCNSALEAFNFAIAASALHKFFLLDFADFYLESCKPIFNNSEEPSALAVERNFEFVFESFLRLMSPFMPFLTEELWQRLPNRDTSIASIMLADYPTTDTHCFKDPDLDSHIANVRSSIQAIRGTRQKFGVGTSETVPVAISCMRACDMKGLAESLDVLRFLTKCGEVSFLTATDPLPPGYIGCAAADGSIKVFARLKGMVDVELQSQKFAKKHAAHMQKLDAAQNKHAKTTGDPSNKIDEELAAIMRDLKEVEEALSTLDTLR